MNNKPEETEMIKRCVRVLFLVLFFFTLLLPLPVFCVDGQARDITADAVMEDGALPKSAQRSV